MSRNESSQDAEKSDCSTPTDMVNIMEDTEKGDVKMVGYLEKRGKMKLLSTWKRYWFVLEGRLLLYYRSQLEYLNLSACRGSLNMGIASCVRPGVQRGAVPGPGYIIEVVTRTQVVTLRTKDRAVQEQWLQALLDSMALPNISSPMRNSGGPLHFRYSMDNLPTVDEMEQTDDKMKDKQGTLPRQPKAPSVSRRDSVLMRIRRLGGQSYGGSLDTILRRQVGSQMQQQPNIPRIKAVDRMVGLQAGFTDEEPADDQTNIYSECLTPATQTNESSGAFSSLLLQEERSKQVLSMLPQEKLNKEQCSKNQGLDTDSLESSLENQAKTNCSAELHKPTVPEKPSNTNRSCRQNEVKRECNENEQSQYVSVENQLYVKMPDETHNDEQYGSSEELASYSKKTESEEEEIYEAVTVQESINDVKPEVDEYYSSYDQTLLNEHNKEHNINPTPEPVLPPRPSISSPETPDAETEYVEYNACYEPESKLQSELLSSGEDKKVTKKGKMKLKNRKSTGKDCVIPENIKKRKVSFLRRMLKHYRKKPEPAPSQESSDEPEYETVDYTVALPSTRNKDAAKECEMIGSRDIFGTALLLPNNALMELRQKLKKREDGSEITEPEADKNLLQDGNKRVPSSDLMDEKSKPEYEEDTNINSERLQTSNSQDNHKIIPPQLPPRRTRRPSSPWHDIPTNNSPIYGNFNFQTSSNSGKSSTEVGEWSQDLQDEMLGTPQGFAYIQNKWKVAERSGEWHRELRQVSFPANARNQGPKLLHEDGNSGHILQHEHHEKRDEDNTQWTGAIDLYSKVLKRFSEKSNSSSVESEAEEYPTDCYDKERCMLERNIGSESVFLAHNNFALLNITSKTMKEDTGEFQKDSLMTSMCTETDSELEVSIDTSDAEENCRTDFHEQHVGNSRTRIASTEKVEVFVGEQRKGDCNTSTTNRYSDELNLLLAQLAEITCAPLLSPGATKSLIDFPESKSSKLQDLSLSDQITLLGPIRRRRHSEPDYDVPRPHNSLLQIVPSHGSNVHPQQTPPNQEKDVTVEKHFHGKCLSEDNAELSVRRENKTEKMDQSQLSWTLSMAPDSLETIPPKYQETEDSGS